MDPAIEPMTDWQREAERLRIRVEDLETIIDALSSLLMRMASGSARPSPVERVPGLASPTDAG